MKTKLALTAFVAAFMLSACGSKTEAPAPAAAPPPAAAPAADAAASAAADSAAAASAAPDAAASAASGAQPLYASDLADHPSPGGLPSGMFVRAVSFKGGVSLL